MGEVNKPNTIEDLIELAQTYIHEENNLNLIGTICIYLCHI